MRATKERLPVDSATMVLFRVVRVEIVEEEALPLCRAAAMRREFNAEARREGIAERAILEPLAKETA